MPNFEAPQRGTFFIQFVDPSTRYPLALSFYLSIPITMSTIIKQEPVEEDDVVVTKVVSAEEQESSVASMMQMIPVNDRAKANMIARFPMDSRVLHSWWEKEEPYAVYGTISAVAIGLFNPHDVFYKVSFGNGDFKMLMNQDLLFGPDTPVWVLLPGTRHYTSCTVISAARPFAFSMTYTVSDATTRKIFCAVHDKHVCYRWDDQPPKIDEALLVDEVSLFPEQDTRNDQEQPNAVALPQGKSKDPERPNAVVAEQSTVLTSSAETQEASTHQDSVASNDSLPSTVYVAGEEAEPKTTDLMNDDQDMFRESSNKDNSMLSFNFLSPSQPKRRRVSRSPEEGEIDDGEVLLLTERTIRIPFWANSKQLKGSSRSLNLLQSFFLLTFGLLQLNSRFCAV